MSKRKIVWKTNGIKIDPGTGKPYPRTERNEICIPEDKRTVNMGGNDVYGLPIDANVATYLIKRFIDIYDKFNGLSDKELEADNVDNSKQPEDADAKAFFKAFAKKILDTTYGITFDKNIVTKILSQPCCEGLRLYLCAQEDKLLLNHDSSNDWSLVLVGVDKRGNDLHYNEPDTINKPAIDISTKSAVAEYAHPPKSETFEDRKNDRRYTLLYLANKP